MNSWINNGNFIFTKFGLFLFLDRSSWSSHITCKIRIFSEIDEPLNFNENMSTNTVLIVVSYNDVRFFAEIVI